MTSAVGRIGATARALRGNAAVRTLPVLAAHPALLPLRDLSVDVDADTWMALAVELFLAVRELGDQGLMLMLRGGAGSSRTWTPVGLGDDPTTVRSGETRDIVVDASIASALEQMSPATGLPGLGDAAVATLADLVSDLTVGRWLDIVTVEGDVVHSLGWPTLVAALEELQSARGELGPRSQALVVFIADVASHGRAAGRGREAASGDAGLIEALTAVQPVTLEMAAHLALPRVFDADLVEAVRLELVRSAASDIALGVLPPPLASGRANMSPFFSVGNGRYSCAHDVREALLTWLLQNRDAGHVEALCDLVARWLRAPLTAPQPTATTQHVALDSYRNPALVLRALRDRLDAAVSPPTTTGETELLRARATLAIVVDDIATARWGLRLRLSSGLRSAFGQLWRDAAVVSAVLDAGGVGEPTTATTNSAVTTALTAIVSPGVAAWLSRFDVGRLTSSPSDRADHGL